MPKRPTRGPRSYTDVIAAMNQAMMYGGNKLVCDNEGKARHTEQRMHAFRALQRKINMEQKHLRPLPENPTYREMEIENRERLVYLTTEYDKLVVRRIGATIILERRSGFPWKYATDLEGNPIEIDEEPDAWDPIEAERREHSDKDAARYRARNPNREKENDIDPDKPLGLMDEE